MDPYNPIHDWHAGKAAELYVRELRWRQRWAALRRAIVPAGIAVAVVLLWLAHRL